MTREAAVKTDAGALRALANDARCSQSGDGGDRLNWKLMAAEVFDVLAAEREAATNTRAGLREAVARILDPGGWEMHDTYRRYADQTVFRDEEPGYLNAAESYVEISLSRADRILALLPVQSAVNAARARAEGLQEQLDLAAGRLEWIAGYSAVEMDDDLRSLLKGWAGKARAYRALSPDAPVFLTQEESSAAYEALQVARDLIDDLRSGRRPADDVALFGVGTWLSDVDAILDSRSRSAQRAGEGGGS